MTKHTPKTSLQWTASQRVQDGMNAPRRPANNTRRQLIKAMRDENEERADRLATAIAIAERIYARRNGGTRNVMASLFGGYPENARHLKLFKDDGGLYVRTGKRGAIKKYLHDMHDARIVDEGLDLAVFQERDRSITPRAAEGR